MVRTKKLSRWGKSKKFSHPFCLPHLNTWWMPDDADFCLPPVVNKTVFFPGLFCACFCYTLFCESGSWSRNKECILFCQAFPQRFSILSIMMTWIMMFFFFLFFRFASFFYIFHIMSMQKADAYYCTLFCLCLWSRHIIDNIKNLQKHLENPSKSSWIRSKTWKNTWKTQEPHHG